MDETRRNLLRRGMVLATATPALAFVVGSQKAFAEDDEQRGNTNNDNNNDGEDGGRDNGRAPRQNQPSAGRNGTFFTSELCRVSQANGDLASTRVGSDSLSSGAVSVRRSDRVVVVSLRGAPAGASYEVMLRTPAGGSTSLGTIGPTDTNGNLDATAPTALGAGRAGVFVLVRRDGTTEAGNDEFVSCLGG